MTYGRSCDLFGNTFSPILECISSLMIDFFFPMLGAVALKKNFSALKEIN